MSNQPKYCSFCGKSEDEVFVLIAGPTVFICDEDVELCNDIVAKHRAGNPTPEGRPFSEFRAEVLEKCAASGMDARQGGNEVPSRSDDSPVPEGQTPNSESNPSPCPPEIE